MNDRYHLTLSLGRELWEDLLRAALPVTMSEGDVDIAAIARQATAQLGVRERVRGLLEDRSRFSTPLHVRDRARALVRRGRKRLRRTAREVVRVELAYKVELDALGTNLRYGRQRVSADAWLKGTAEGIVFLARDNVELPFHLERRVGASVALADIHYDKGRGAVIGSLQDLAVRFGDRAAMQLMARIAELALERQMDGVNPVPILRRDQVADMVGPMGGALRVKMGVEDLDLRVDEHEMTLRVRFGFAHAQIEDRTVG